MNDIPLTNSIYNPFPQGVTNMSRGNVFKLSGNMALGGSDYGNSDIEQIKNSLKLLKAKKNQRQMSEDQQNGYAYNAIPPTKNYTMTKNDYNYEALAKNSYPSSQKEPTYDYGNKQYGGDYQAPPRNSGYSKPPVRQNDPYDYGSKPMSYTTDSNTRNARNARTMQPEYHEEKPSYSSKNIAQKPSVAQPRADHNSYNRQPAKKSYQPEPQYYNDKEERSIKEVNRENRVDIVEYDPSQLRPCRVCGRKFNPESIGKHEANCNKVFQKKRKEFKAAQQRIIDNQQKKLMKNGEVAQKKLEAMEKNQKIPKWKADSLAFRAGLKQTKNAPLDPKQAAMLQQAQDEAGVKCPHCGRKFNDTAGPRHIKFCQEQAKKNMVKKKR